MIGLAGIIFGLVAVILLIACILTRNYKSSMFSKKEYKTGMGLALWLEEQIGLPVKVGADMWKAMDNVQCHESVEEAMRKHTVRKIYYVIIVLLVICLSGCVLCIRSAAQEKKESEVKRPSPGEGEVYVTKKVIIDDGKKEDITFEVSERKPDEEETQAAIDNAIEYIDENYLGDNNSPEEVFKPLNLMSVIPESDVYVTWITDEEGYISADGTVERIRQEEGVDVSICALLEYGDYEQRHYIPLRLVKRQENISDKETLLDAINQEDESTIQKSSLVLPEVIGDKKVKYIGDSGEKIIFILVLGLVAIVGIMYYCDLEIKKKNELRKEEMLFDFPEIMSKFCLFLRAGMTVRGAWNVISTGATTKDENKFTHYIYKEMQITQNEIRNGLTWREAVERFGVRCDLLQYNKFANWLVQSNTRGTDNLIMLLETERYEARADRNKIIMINGEKISQRLLLPMIGLLAVVMAIIVIPAFVGL